MSANPSSPSNRTGTRPEAPVRTTDAAHRTRAISLGLANGVLETTLDGFLVVDLEGKVLFANQNFLTMWRISPEAAASGDDARLLGEVLAQLADPDRFLARVRELYAHDHEASQEEEIEFKDGRVFVRWSRPVYVEAEPVARIWLFRDATLERQHERERALLEEQLRQSQKMEAIGTLAGGIAHDFNNLLTVIFGHAELLKARLPESDDRRGSACEIADASRRATALIQKLLAFSRKQILSPTAVDAREIVDGLVPMLQRIIGDDHALVPRHAGGPCVVRADRVQIEQVLVNLVVNARDAMPEGGSIRITTRTERRPSVTQANAHEDFACIEVADSGCGMTPETLEHIFEPFFTTKRPGQGTGLGLSMAYGIVKQSHGHIEVTSAPGSGSTFRVLLPVSVGPSEPAREPAAGAAAPRMSGTLLLVEDDAAVRTLTASLLTDAGFTVLSAGDAEEALQLERSHTGPLHLLVTDVNMPGMKGPELRERLRTRRPALRALFISGYAGEEGLGRLAEGDAFLPKPFTPRALAERVAGMLTPTR